MIVHLEQDFVLTRTFGIHIVLGESCPVKDALRRNLRTVFWVIDVSALALTDIIVCYAHCVEIKIKCNFQYNNI